MSCSGMALPEEAIRPVEEGFSMKILHISYIGITVLLILHCSSVVTSEYCLNSDLLTKADATPKRHISDKKSWAIVCLLRASDRSEYTRRNRALAAILAPAADKHDFTILMFSEDRFPVAEVDSWKKQFSQVGDVRLIDVNPKAYNLPSRFGYKWMCKFFTVDLYEYITNFDYYLRVDSDNVIVAPDDKNYDFFSWVEQNDVEYGYVIRKFEPHKETRDTLPQFVADYVKKCDIHPQIKHPVLTTLFNFYNNFHTGKMSFFLRPEVRHFLVATNTSELLYRYRWGDSTLQAMAVRLFMDPNRVRQIPNISYHHLSHQNKLASSQPRAQVTIPQVFKDGNGLWTDDPALSDLKLVMKKPPAPALPSTDASDPSGSALLTAKKTGSMGSKKLDSMLKGRIKHGKKSSRARR